jgi:hypothetical protein
MQKLVNLILNWFVSYVVIPISVWLVDYFRLRKINKDLQEKVDALEKAKTVQEKIDAANSLP